MFNVPYFISYVNFFLVFFSIFLYKHKNPFSWLGIPIKLPIFCLYLLLNRFDTFAFKNTPPLDTNAYEKGTVRITATVPCLLISIFLWLHHYGSLPYHILILYFL
ncbi:hypothetical protein D3Z38_17735 [Clostridiales bacterium]|nr:hypothetical protein [Clostridiales bacterium]